MKHPKLTLCILAILLLAGICCTPAGAWHSSTDAKLTQTTQTEIAPGTHVVLLKKEGYLDDEQTITFEAGTTYEISFVLSREAKASEVFVDRIKQYPTIALIGVIIIGFGVLVLLIRRKR